MSGPASVDLVVAHRAALRAGYVVVPVNAAYTPRELAVIAGDARPRAAVLGDADLRDAAAGLDLDPPPVVTGTGGPPADLRPPSTPWARATRAAALHVGHHRHAQGALLSHGNLLASAEALRLAWRWVEDDCLILCLPLFHMHGLGVGLHGTLLAGRGPSSSPGSRSATCWRRPPMPTWGPPCSSVPTMYARLAAAADLDPLRRLRLCVSGRPPGRRPARPHRGARARPCWSATA